MAKRGKSSREIRRQQIRADRRALAEIPLTPAEQLRAQFYRNGITAEDVQKAYEKGCQDGRTFAEEFAFHTIYAAFLITMVETHGMDADIVSNHGGRQLDGSLAPLQALPAIVDAAGGMDVMLDSGVRRGTDVLKAMALGARCVFVGRPFNYAATVAGERGVAHAIALISEEIRRDMGLLGIVDLREINESLLQRCR